MDECDYLDQFLYSPSFSDFDLRQRMLELCNNEEENNNSNGSSSVEEACSAVLNSESDFGVNMFTGQNLNGNCSDGAMNGGSMPWEGCDPFNVAAPMSGNVSSCLLPQQEMVKSESVMQIFPRDLRPLSQVTGFDGVGAFGFDDELFTMENLSANFSTPISSKGMGHIQDFPLPSLASAHQTTLTTNGFESLLQTASAAPTGECNGTGKPRVRARRGQATDPHSIAERLRREKISDRMKNLQELLPNPNKTDKASMLDEIIEYVKFLQLQVKVLSTSRLGAADAVVPLITDQPEGGNGFFSSTSSGQLADIAFPSDEAAFERELVKLMESNVTKAMQFLQTKGLCLMPVALASAMSPQKDKENGVHTLPTNGNLVTRNPAATECNYVVVNPEDEKKISVNVSRDVKPKI